MPIACTDGTVGEPTHNAGFGSLVVTRASAGVCSALGITQAAASRAASWTDPRSTILLSASCSATLGDPQADGRGATPADTAATLYCDRSWDSADNRASDVRPDAGEIDPGDADDVRQGGHAYYRSSGNVLES